MRRTMIWALLAGAVAMSGCGQVPERDDEQEQSGGAGGELPSGTGGSGGGQGGTGGGGPTACELACAMLSSCEPGEYAVEECVEGCEAEMAERGSDACAACIAASTCDDFMDDCEAACARPEEIWHDLTLQGAGLAAYDGKDIFVAIVDAEYDEVYDYYSWKLGVDEPTDFSVTLEEMFWEHAAVRIDVFIDANDNSVCDATGDVAWRFELPDVIADTTLTISPAAPTFGGACASFSWLPLDLTIEGTGFGANEGATAVITVFEVYEGREGRVDGEPTEPGAGEYPIVETAAQIVDGGFSITLPQSIYADSNLRVKWFVDADASGHCESSDPGGETQLQGPFQAAPTVSLSPASPPEAAVCADFPGYGFDVSLQASGFDAYNGKDVQAGLFDAAGNWVGYGDTVVRLGSFEVLFTGNAQYGESYTVGLFIDADGDWECTVPGDGVWSLPVGPVDGDEVLTTGVPTEMDDTMCSSFGWGGEIEE